MRNRRAEVDREWLRMERRERWYNVWLPIIVVCSSGGAVLWIINYTTYGKVVAGIITSVGIPFAMWWNRRK